MVDLGAIRNASKKAAKSATEGALKVFNKADELGGEIRDFLQEKVWEDERVTKFRSQVQEKLGRKAAKTDATAETQTTTESGASSDATADDTTAAN